MSNPYSQPTLTGYNSNPPSDDGSEVSTNQVSWAKHKDKLADPLKTFAQAVDSNVATAFGKIFGASVSEQSTNYAVQTSDQGAFVVCTSAITVTLPAAASAGAGFAIAVLNIAGVGNTVTVDGNSSETINNSTTISLLNGDSIVMTCTGSEWFGSITRTPTLARSYLSGLTLSNGTDTAHDIDIAVGEARDSTDAADLVLSATLTKAVDVNWVAGNGGGFPSGLTLTADTWYRVFLIGKTDGTVDAGFDTSATAANLLSDATGYTLYRQIGWIRTYTGTGPDIRQFTQVGDVFYYDSPSSLTLDNDGSVTADTDTTITITNAPASTIARLHLYGANTGNEGFHLNAHPTSVATASHSVTAAPLTNMGQSGASLSAPASGFMSMQIDMQLDSSSQFHVRSSSGITLRALAVGWIDRRGRDD